MRYAVLVLMMSFVLAACKTDSYVNDAESPTITLPFNEAEAEYVKGLGTATVKGVASFVLEGTLIRGRGARVRLVPVTAYSTEYFRLLFRGEKSFSYAAEVQRVDPKFHTYMRYAQTDDQGNFVFYGVPSGDFYLYTVVRGRYSRGAALYDRITVADAQTVELALDGT